MSEQATSFDKVASLYTVRRGYPAALFAELEVLTERKLAGGVLEVGCGAGQATVDLASYARRLTAVDPGSSLIEEAKALVTAEGVQFVVSRFEDFEAASSSFDLVVSAQAWHWVDQAVGFSKAARLLAPDGYLAIFGHVPLPIDGALGESFKAAFDLYAPGLWGRPPPQAAYLPSGPFAGMIESSALFGSVTHRGYDWSWRMDSQTLSRYLRTDSSYLFLPEAERFALFDEMAEAVRAAGDLIISRWQTHLYVAQATGSQPC